MTPSRQLTLSARTLAELNDYLKKTYSVMGEEEEEPEEGGFVECHLCMSFVSEVSLALFHPLSFFGACGTRISSLIHF